MGELEVGFETPAVPEHGLTQPQLAAASVGNLRRLGIISVDFTRRLTDDSEYQNLEPASAQLAAEFAQPGQVHKTTKGVLEITFFWRPILSSRRLRDRDDRPARRELGGGVR